MRTLSKEEQQSITPKKALQILKDGNQRFVNNLKLNRDFMQQVYQSSAAGQYPFAVILHCMDSRAPAEIIFDQGLGDIFSIRIAGNVLNDDILGSIEFACKVVGTKLVAVIGHTQCGAIKGACDSVKMGHLSQLLEKLDPVFEKNKTPVSERSSENIDLVDRITRLNVVHTKNQIIAQSDILREMFEKDQIGLVGGIYSVETGSVEFFPEEKSS